MNADNLRDGTSMGHIDSWASRAMHYLPRTTICLVLASLFFAASLTPSLMPRDPVVQGLLAGSVAILGYGIGYLIRWLWLFLGIPQPFADLHNRFRLLGYCLMLIVLISSLWKAAHWQNATRSAMNLEPVSTSQPITILLVAAAVFTLLWLLVLCFQFVLRMVRSKLDKLVPRRVSAFIGFTLAAWLFWALGDGVLVRYAFALANSSFEAADRFIEPTIAQPKDPMSTGSAASLINWKNVGRWGRDYIQRAPNRNEIAAFVGDQAMRPIRIYVGLRAASTPNDRAELALKELIRVGGFKRSTLVIMVPVGTGWMDPGGQDTLEFIMGGNVATVAVQYSYLKGALSVLTDTKVGLEQSRELFNAVYDYWTKLPKSDRPNLYVHGLSQGAQLSQSTLPFLDFLADPIQGALWVGAPFFSPISKHVHDERVPGSPSWLPKYGNGSLIRFANQKPNLQTFDAPWSPIRLGFLNYGSDPMVAFSYATAYRRPDWMNEPRAFDVAPELQWVPIVTMLQIALDTAFSLSVPGFGHYYVAPDYIDAWAEVLDPPGWSKARSEKLKRIFVQREPAF
jgi:uncharacterized membrane protein